MSVIRNIYKAVRGVLFTAIVMVVAVWLALYILLSVPPFQNYVKDTAVKELSALIGSDVSVETLTVHPFNEVVLHGVKVNDRSGRQCLYVETLGAGIQLWTLLRDRKVALSYAEIIGLDARISQPSQGAPLNIQFIIDAFKPKDKNKPPKKFDLTLRNVVLRRCQVSFDREWMPRLADTLRTDFNHLRLFDLKADVNLPRISNDDISIDLRRLAFRLSGGLDVQTIALKTHITPKSLSVGNLVVKLPLTELRPSDFSLNFQDFAHIKESLEVGDHRIVMVDNPVSPSDFGWLLPPLRDYSEPLALSAEISGNLSDVALDRFLLDSEDYGVKVALSGRASDLLQSDKAAVKADGLEISLKSKAVAVIKGHLPSLSPAADRILSEIGDVDIVAAGEGRPASGDVEVDLKAVTSIGSATLAATASGLKNRSGHFKGELATEDLDLGVISGLQELGAANLTADFEGDLKGKDADGELNLYVGDVDYRGRVYGGVTAFARKSGKDCNAQIEVDNEISKMDLTADAHIDRQESWVDLLANVAYLHPSMLGLLPKYPDHTLSGTLSAQLQGDNVDNVTGELRLTDFSFHAPNQKSIQLDRLLLTAANDEEGRHIVLKSDWLDGKVDGNFKVAELPLEVKCMAAEVFPSLLECQRPEKGFTSDISFDLLVKNNNSLTEFFDLPFRMLVDMPVNGGIDGFDNTAWIDFDLPYLQQGKNKLVRDTRLSLRLDGDDGTARLGAATVFPAKKGDMSLNLNVFSVEDNVLADVDWMTLDNTFLNGSLSLGAQIDKDELTGKPEVAIDLKPSLLEFGTAKWNIDRSRISFKDGALDVKDFKLWHEGQFIDISGRASADPLDSLSVRLAGIDLGSIFETLNINYVAFGGIATGDLTARGALGKEPIASTDNLNVKGLAYNGAVLGDAILKSHWDNRQKEVTITADITGDEGNKSVIDGGIWVTRDSLSFDIDAHRVPVNFLAPFMEAFTSDVKGRASGTAKLFGTFSDIDLVGRVLADSVAIKLDYTNVYYHGTDSVYLEPGKIIIPSFRLYDRYGNSAIMTGELTHRYFHDPRFNFRISDVRNMLVYDTNAKMNPDWYGTLYGNGSAVVRGWPGTVSVSVDMTAVGKSSFTFVLNDTQAAEDYRFLTFSDRKKEEEKLRADTVPSVLDAFRKKVEKNDDRPSTFILDMRGTVTPSTLMTLVMDPVAGDKINARGNGNLQMDYDSESDALQMFGKYTLEEGTYNFSLQDLILRDFNIRRGSSISFNGDPFNGMLDITATYRVNTNLSDLDKSFSTDRELTRTNVPVDAVLMVDGEMQHPDITFDIELPTLTQDVTRKVKSIISTDDMMSRQIIYLLALNRFYTPEYMGSTSNGGELASVASSTLSSQLQNMLGQLTDKFTLAPSFRSDKGDFSDIEVDVALSSRLLNNRLLVNGNFGYRDRSTSTTTFVGDFDIEYLLSRSGNLRLKAYNHFNDQNYYLRQALTTQGLGVIYRKDFDNPFTWLHKKKKDKKEEKKEEEKKDEQKNVEPADTLLHFK